MNYEKQPAMLQKDTNVSIQARPGINAGFLFVPAKSMILLNEIKIIIT